MSRRQRYNTILRTLETDGALDVTDMAARLDVSTMTIRRDLDELEGQGKLIRTHGGAVPATRTRIEFQFAERHQSRLREKQAIAREAAARVAAGQCILLDTGTTTLEVAQAVRHVEGLRVVTTSLAVAATLYAQGGTELILLGGTVRQTSPDLSGPLTEENLAGFRVDTVFLGADAACREGLYTESLAVGRLSRGMIACAGCVILVMDHTKFTRRAFRRYASWDDVDILITDDAVPDCTRDWLAEAGVRVCYASPR